MKKQNAICSFRLDDITANMNWDTFYEVKSVFDKYSIRPLIGVVPDNQDPTLQKGELCECFWDIIRRLAENGWSIAQHGYQHVYCSNSSGILGLKNASEFAGVPYRLQYAKVGMGKEILQKQGIYVTIFMAPGHTFDRNTLRVLKKHGFRYITDGYSYTAYKRCGILHIPCRSAKLQVGIGMDTICLHTNAMKPIDISELDRFISQNREHIVDYEELMKRANGSKVYYAFLSERLNLMLWRVKKFASNNNIIHEYLIETDDTDSTAKVLRRIKNLPKLLLNLLIKK